QDIFDLTTTTAIDELTAKSGGISYLKKTKVGLEAGINIDMPNMKFTLRDNELSINDLLVKAAGWIAMPGDDVDMDLSFSAPQSDFKSLLSLIPNAYIEGYEDVKASGTFQLAGTAKGTYSSSSEEYPAFDIQLNVEDGNIKYPDLPLGISGINTQVAVHSPSSDLDKMLVGVSAFRLKIGGNPLEGYFKIKTPLSDPDVDTKLKGVLDLKAFARAFPMEDVQSLDGIIEADFVARSRMSVIDRGDYESVKMSGSASVKDLHYVADDLPPVSISSMRIDIAPQKLEVPEFKMQLGKSDISGHASIGNVLAYFSPWATMRGDVTLRSDYFNADEWMTEEQSSANATPTGVAPEEGEGFDRFDFTFDGAVKSMDYDVYHLKHLAAKGHLTPNKFKLSQLSGVIGDSDFSASGEITNVWNYLFKDETLGGQLSLRSSYMDLNQFMVPDSAAEAAAVEPFLVPANMNLRMNANIGAVLYDNIELTKVQGILTVADEQVRFDEVTAKTLGGSMAIDGGYDTRNHEKPKFDLSMNLQQMDFQKAFNTFNTFQLVAPVGKWLQGNFDTQLKFSSDLTKDLMPDIATLNMDGMLHTINGAIKGFGPLEQIGNKLNVDVLKSITLEDTKNWFTVKDGGVELKEFDYKYQDINLKIGGTHKIAGGMNYNIVAKIPRDKIGKNPLGAAANSGLDFLGKEAAKAGLNLDAGEFVNVQINLTGTIAEPKLTFKILGSGGETSLKNAVAGKVKGEAKKQLDEVKTEAKLQLQDEKKKATDAAAKAVQDVKKDLGKKAGDVTKKAREEVKKNVKEEAKKKIKELNPFKKKKKGGG
ncbi:MAG: AsmA-like C-terminal region-containing protein, partial [Saprospiraceae bacterium]